MNSVLKKILYGLITICLVVLPLNVQALEGSLQLNCSKTKIAPGETISCTLNGTVTGDSVSAVSAKISTSNNTFLTLEEKVIVNGSIWVGDADNGEVELYTDSNKTGTFEIVKFNLTASSNITLGEDTEVRVSDVSFVDSNFKSVSVANASQAIRIASNTNTLSSLSISAGTISPEFNKNITTYTAVVDSSEVTISAIPTDSNSIITGADKKSLNYGMNSFQVNVRSEANTLKTYTINITRPDNRDTDNYLKTLTINNNAISLSRDKTNYTYQVENDVVEASIKATLNSSKSVFKDGIDTKKISLNEGDNKVIIQVVAENQQSRTYTITINRKSKSVVEPNDKVEEDKNDVTSNDKIEENIEEVPKEGSSIIYLYILLIIVSIPVSIIAYKNYKKI